MSKRKMTATQRLRQNVLRTIRRAEKRGYVFDPELKSQVKEASYQKLASLQRRKYSKLYEQATVNVGGETFSGTIYRFVIEPRKAAQKGQETRRRKKRQAATSVYPGEEGEIIYKQVKKMIDEHPTPGARVLNAQLNSEIERHGFSIVMEALAKSPQEMVSAAQTAIEYKSDKESTARAFNRFFTLLKGAIMSVKESREAGNVTDTPEYQESDA